MSVSTVAEEPGLSAIPQVSAWSKTVRDLVEGLRARHLWGHLGWQDIRRGYRRSLIGPFWMTITMGTTTLGLGLLFGLLFHNRLATFLPYIGTGMIVWGFINGCLQDGPESFTANDETIKQLPVPLTTFVLRTVWRQLLMMAHNMLIYVVLLVVFFPELHTANYTMTGEPCGATGVTCQPGIGWNILLAIPGMALLILAMTAAALGLSVVATRFRDIKPLIGALVGLLFFITPISWPLDTLVRQIGGRQWILQLNPLFHFVQIVRQPLIGQRVDWWSWLVAAGLTILAWAAAALLMRRYRHRVSYWL